jgi:hypothetical protein
VAGQVSMHPITGATILIQAGKNNFTATRNSTGNTIIGFPNIGGHAYTPFMQILTIVGITSFVGATSTQFQLLTYNSSGQAADTTYAFSCIEHFNNIWYFQKQYLNYI